MGGRRLPESLRGEFKRPVGRPIGDPELRELGSKKLITVGDVVSLAAVRLGNPPDLAVYDGMTERREMTEFARLVSEGGWEVSVARNPAGTVTAELCDAVRNALEGESRAIRVEGEEDLALLPCVLLSPDGCDVVYGMPGEGMMHVATDAESRKEIRELWERMEEYE
ncbi:MAG: DUF359 domain-containing protein [Thermoplasmatales archaeon]|nr:DUF359 domain-containing protein [Thermoplasmatales archaeon]